MPPSGMPTFSISTPRFLTNTILWKAVMLKVPSFIHSLPSISLGEAWRHLSESHFGEPSSVCHFSETSFERLPNTEGRTRQVRGTTWKAGASPRPDEHYVHIWGVYSRSVCERDIFRRDLLPKSKNSLDSARLILISPFQVLTWPFQASERYVLYVLDFWVSNCTTYSVRTVRSGGDAHVGR